MSLPIRMTNGCLRLCVHALPRWVINYSTDRLGPFLKRACELTGMDAALPEWAYKVQARTLRWGPELVKQRPDITMGQVEKFLTRMYRTNPDFVGPRRGRVD